MQPGGAARRPGRVALRPDDRLASPAMTSLPGFTASPFTHEGVTRTVFRRGAGPAVLVMTEIPGITPQVRGFAERVAAAGFTVFMPHLFGTPDKPMTMPYA